MKLQQIQQELNAPKDLKNEFGGYNYRSCESILAALKPLLAKHECSLIISDGIVEAGGWHYIKATATITDGTETHSSEAYAREQEIKKGMDAAQITGAASSYARKYALNGLFAIDDTKDPDATNRHDDEPPQRKQADPYKAEIGDPRKFICHVGKTTKGKRVEELTEEQLQYFANDFDAKTNQDKDLKSAAIQTLENLEF